MSNTKDYLFKSSTHPSKKLFIRFYSEKIVRFFYGDRIKENISNAVILEPSDVFSEIIENRKISSAYFDIEVSDNLLIKITDKQGKTIIEDNKIEFNKKEDLRRDLGDIENFGKEDSQEIIPIKVEKKHLWEKGFYGMGEKYGHINLLDRYTENWNTDVIGVTTAHQAVQKSYHTSIPFYIGADEKNSYGIYYDNSFRNSFDFGKFSKNISFKAHGGDLDYYFIYGEKISDVVENYGKLTGTVKLPRKDFLGYQQCRWSYMDTKEVLEIAKNMREKDIPCDVIYLDIDYMQDYKVFTINSERFKEFKEMTKELHEKGFKLVVIIDPGVKVEESYKAYDQGIKNDYFIKDENGEVYVGKVWPGDSVFPDFLRKSVRDWWGELHRGLINKGVDGIWNDMNEVSDMSTSSKTVPENTYHLDENGNKRYQKEIHNLYGHYEAISTYEALKKIQGTRPFVLTRAASAGTQRNSALWTGDNSSVWEHLEGSIPMLLNLGLSGYSYVGSDIGGFLDDSTKELLIRWTQLGIFYPLCRNHSVLNSLHQEPWSFDEETLEITRKYIKLRYSFMDYLYNLFRESSLKGTPIMRPLFYHYQNDEKTLNINNEFLFGDSLLVAPITKPKEDTGLIYLPEGIWIDYFTGEKFEGKKYIIRTSKLSELPLFVKEGAILLKNKEMQYVGQNSFKREIHVYSGQNNEKEFYFDDGISFDYEKGRYSLINVTLENNNVTIKKIKNDYPTGDFDLVIYNNNKTERIENIKFDFSYNVDI